jgi:uncharacterized membrane protein
MFDHFKSGWQVVKNGLVGWIIFGIVLMVLMSFGVGIFFMPNAYRAIRNAAQAQSAPEIGALFNFDHIVEDAVAMIVYTVAIWIGSLLCGVGAIAAMLLLFWLPMLAAEGRYAAIDAAKASLAHAKANIGAIVVFLLIAWLINMGGAMVCYVGVLVTFPVTMAAQWLFYSQHRDAILAAANAAGVPTKP